MNGPRHNDSENRIISGEFPQKQLWPVDYTKPIRFFLLDDFDLDLIKSIDEQISLYISVFARVSENSDVREKLFGLSHVHDRTFALINSEYDPDDLPTEAFQEASKICPYITPFDRMLVVICDSLLISLPYLQAEGKSEKETVEGTKIALRVFLTILRTVQNYEVYSLRTVNMKAIDASFSLFTMLHDWKEAIDSVYDFSGVCFERFEEWTKQNNNMVLLSEQERRGLLELSRKRSNLRKTVQTSFNSMVTIGKETYNNWTSFLELVYKMSKREESIIQTIVDKRATVEEKLRAIESYENELRNYQNEMLSIHGLQDNCENIFESVEKRIDYPQLLWVRDDDGFEFRLNPILFYTTKRHENYNYFYIQYHHCRLSSFSPEVVSVFLKLSLSVIKRNLLQRTEPTMKGSPWLDIVSSFYDVVFTFYESNQETIESLSYCHVQKSEVNWGEYSLATIEYHSTINDALEQNKTIKEKVEKIITDKQSEYEGESISGQEYCDFLANTIVDNLNNQLNQEQDFFARSEQARKKAKARQIVVSLDIIYLFCNAVQIILEGPERYGVDSESEEKIRYYFEQLSRLEGRINRKVYADIPLNEQDIREVRQIQGVDSKRISEQERDEENLRNDAFMNAYTYEVKQILNKIETGNVEESFSAKSMAQENLSRLPDCKYKRKSLELFEAISRDVCRILVEKEKKNVKSFSTQKELILARLGNKSKMLPDASIDSLTTAEFLYHKYVSTEYAEKNFDYSCISCLYYQALEEAYSALIWREYADRLNHLVVDGHAFIDLLRKKQSTNCAKTIGKYFYCEYRDWKNYYDRSLGQFSRVCMFGPFTKLLMEVIEQGQLVKFREYFAIKTGFATVDEMQGNRGFMEKCTQFVERINNCSDNRNKASHGGKRIDAEQCKADKWTVISDLESVREDSIGLIQQLLYLMDYRQDTPCS